MHIAIFEAYGYPSSGMNEGTVPLHRASEAARYSCTDAAKLAAMNMVIGDMMRAVAVNSPDRQALNSRKINSLLEDT